MGWLWMSVEEWLRRLQAQQELPGELRPTIADTAVAQAEHG